MTPAIAFLALWQQDFNKPFTTSQAVRLAISPVLDGRIEEEEWDPLSTDGGCPSYFQWEPETVYWAASAKDGQDIVLSLDSRADGWLVGRDNLEFRVASTNSQPTLSVRRLDATDPNGPAWIDAHVPQESVKLVAGKTADGWCLEASYTPPADAAVAQGQRLGVRIDAVATGSDVGAAYLPRPLAFCTLQVDMGQNLPSGFSWRPDFLVRTVPVDDTFKVKYGFKKTEQVDFNQIEYRTEGMSREAMAAGSRPFPQWDKKGHAGDEYTTAIAKDAGVGYRVLRLTLKQPGQPDTVLRSSFKVADLVEFQVNLPKSLPADPEARIVRGSVDIRSNGLRRINGHFGLKLPEDWTATRGKETDFVIYHSRGAAKVPIEIIVPKNTVGVFPVTFTSTIGEKVVTKTIYVQVGQS